MPGFRDDAVRVAGDDFGDALGLLGWLQPAVAGFDQLSGRVGDAHRAGGCGVVGSRYAWDQAFGIGKVSKRVVAGYLGSFPTPRYLPTRSDQRSCRREWSTPKVTSSTRVMTDRLFSGTTPAGSRAKTRCFEATGSR